MTKYQLIFPFSLGNNIKVFNIYNTCDTILHTEKYVYNTLLAWLALIVRVYITHLYSWCLLGRPSYWVYEFRSVSLAFCIILWDSEVNYLVMVYSEMRLSYTWKDSMVHNCIPHINFLPTAYLVCTSCYSFFTSIENFTCPCSWYVFCHVFTLYQIK